MSILSKKRKRHIVPRWRSSLAVAGASDLQPLRHTKGTPSLPPAPPSVLDVGLAEFRQEPSIGTAADVLSTAVMEGRAKDGIAAAEFIQRHANEAPKALMEIAAAVADGKTLPMLAAQDMESRAAVAAIRRLIRGYPRSAALWADLARHHAALGEKDKAWQAMRVSIGLAPNHRWVLRAANRLLLHIGEHEHAHDLLARHPRTSADPWLMAAEIASAQIMRIAPRHLRRAKDLLRGQSMPMIHLSELATALATNEISDGNKKGARRLLRTALKDPTENALAQIEWVDREAGDNLELDVIVKRVPDAFEASCWLKYHEGQVGEALKAAQSWIADEPFADGPVGAVSHIAALLDDYQMIIDVTSRALDRDPSNYQHINNRIFAQLSNGDAFEDAQRLENVASFLAAHIQEKDTDRIHTSANIGLLLYRLGRIEEGRAFYDAAVSQAERTGGAEIAAFAAIYHLREAVLARTPWAQDILKHANKLASRTSDEAAAFYLRKIEDLMARPEAAREILGPASASRYLSKPDIGALAAQFKLVMSETGPVLFVPAHILKKK